MAVLDAADSGYTACSAEYYNDAILAIGTYQNVLDESAPVNTESPATKRLGRCLLYDTSQEKLNLVFSLDLPAILDMKWKGDSLAMATSQGSIGLYGFADSQLKPLHTIECATPDVLALSLAWSSTSDRIVTSMSDGTCCLCQGEALDQVQSWPAADFEAWIASFDTFDDSVVWSGGDDCKLKAWDIRRGLDAPVQTNKRFDGGVTSIQNHPGREHLLGVGSYDSSFRIFDKRKLTSEVLHENVGGGVWRVKWHPHNSDRVALAVMHGGFKVLDLSSPVELPGQWQVASTHEHRHESIGYGIDWAPSGNVLGVCSFYDHCISLWKPS